MPYFLSTENRRSAFEEDAKWRAKAICRLVALVFALAATALFSSAIGITNANFVNTMGAGDWTDGIALAPILFSLLFNAGMLGAQFLLRQGRPVHPAVPVAGDLLAWAAAVPTLVYAIAGGLFWYWQGDGGIPADDGTLDCALFFNVWTPACNPLAYTVGRLEIAGAVFLFLLFVLHVHLFILSAMDLHRRRLAALSGEQYGFDMQHRKDVEATSQRS